MAMISTLSSVVLATVQFQLPCVDIRPFEDSSASAQGALRLLQQSHAIPLAIDNIVATTNLYTPKCKDFLYGITMLSACTLTCRLELLRLTVIMHSKSN